MATDYVEYPTDVTTALHWADDDDDEEPPPPPPPPIPTGNVYGYGTIVAPTGGIIGAVPYGPIQKAPFVGKFNDPLNPLPVLSGGLEHPYDGGVITASPDGLHAASLLLNPSALVFTNTQLSLLRDATGKLAPNGWTVPMAIGGSVVVKSYTIKMEWSGGFVDGADQVGLGITHPISGAPGVAVKVPAPPEPFLILGSRREGSASYKYDFKYAAWFLGNSPVNTGNQFDPSIGGPAYLWWMTRRLAGDGTYGPWGAGQFMLSTVVGLGDHYTWQIASEIEPVVLF